MSVGEAKFQHPSEMVGSVELDKIHTLLTAYEDGRDVPFVKKALLEMSMRYAHQDKDNDIEFPLITPDNTFNTRIANVRSLRVPRMLKDSRLMVHQMVSKIFMSPTNGYTGILLSHDTGTGKTCTAIAIAEQYIPRMQNPVCVVCAKGIRRQYMNEIVSTKTARLVDGTWSIDKKCSGDAYASHAKRFQNPSMDALVKHMDAFVLSRYEFFGYQALANKWSSGSEDALIRQFSNRVIIVDEAHNLRGSDAKDDKEVLETIMKIASECTNVRIILLTATPMFDHASEVLDLVNILRVNDGKDVAVESDVFPREGAIDEDMLRMAVRGYVSTYKRVVPDRNIPVVLDPIQAHVPGIVTDWPEGDAVLPMVHSSMSDLQESYFSANTLTAVEGHQAVNIVYPSEGGDGVLGEKGFSGVFNRDSGSYVGDHEGCFGDKLGEISPKLKCIVDLAMSCTGIVLVYSKYIFSGLLPIAAALEERGFSACKHNVPMFKKRRVKSNGATYAMLTHGVNEDDIIELVKSKKNTTGDVVKVLLCTSVVSEGIDLRNVREVHIMEAWWNEGVPMQVIGRAVRYKSHEDIAKEERNVTIYRHASVMAGNKEGMDHKMARASMSKVSTIRRTEAILQEESFDCVFAKDVMASEVAALKNDVEVDIVTSQGTRVNYKLLDHKAIGKRVSSMCGKYVSDTHDNTPHRINESSLDEVVQYARDKLGPLLIVGKAYNLGELVEILDLPKDICIWAISELIVRMHVLHLNENTRGTLYQVKDMFAVKQLGWTTFEIAHVSLPIHTDMRKKGVDEHYADVEKLLTQYVKDVDKAVLADMTVDRMLTEGSTVEDMADMEEIDGVDDSIKRLRDDVPQSIASFGSNGLLFTGKKGARCAHYRKGAMLRVMKDNGIAPLESTTSKYAMCVYIEYELRRKRMVKRPKVV